MKRTSRICSGCSEKPLERKSTPAASAGRRMTFAKSKKLLREVKWLGLKIRLHSRYWTSLSGRPSAYLPGLLSGMRRARPIGVGFCWRRGFACVFLAIRCRPGANPTALEERSAARLRARPRDEIEAHETDDEDRREELAEHALRDRHVAGQRRGRGDVAEAHRRERREAEVEDRGDGLEGMGCVKGEVEWLPAAQDRGRVHQDQHDVDERVAVPDHDVETDPT